MNTSKLNSAGLVLALVVICCTLAAPEAIARKYCISGNSNGVGWSWAIDARINLPRPEGPAVSIPVAYTGTVRDGTVESGEGPTKLVDAFVRSINAELKPPAIAQRVSPNCFTVTGFNNRGMDTMVLSVGPVGKPRDCPVGREPCSFNPTIVEVPTEGVPGITGWGLIALGVLLAGSLAFIVRRRFRAHGLRA